MIAILLAAAAITNPSQMTYTGNGGTKRALSDKLSDVVSVKDVCGSAALADYTGCLQTAITAAAGGATFIFPCGAFPFLSGLTVANPGIVFQGQGFCSSLRFAHAGTGITVTGALFGFEDLEAAIPSSVTTTRSGVALIKAQGSQGHISNVRFTGTSATADNGIVLLLADGTADNWAVRGLRVTGGVTLTSVIRATSATGANTVASTRVVDLNCVNPVFSVAAIDLDGAIDTFIVSATDCPTFGGKAIWTHDAAGAGAGFPRWIHFTGTSVEGGNGGGAPTTAIQLDQVRDFSYVTGYVASATTALAVGANAAEVRFSRNEVVSITQSAVTIASGSSDVMIDGDSFEDVGTQTDNTYDVIAVTAPASNWAVKDSFFRSANANKPKNCIGLSAGATDNYQITGNRCQNTSTGILSNAATGSNRSIWGNLGVTNTIGGFQSTFNSQVNLNSGAPLVVRDTSGGIQNDSGNLLLKSSTNNVTLGGTTVLQLGSVAFASLPTPANGMTIYCSDCTIANPCASGGTGALAKRLNGVWVCN